MTRGSKDPQLTIDDIHSNPACISKAITTRSGLELTFRPIQKTDAAMLGRYFLGLSEELKALYAPHPFDQATADQLCAAVETDFIRMVGVLLGAQKQEASTSSARLDDQEQGASTSSARLEGEGRGEGEIIAYFILQLSTPPHEIELYANVGVAITAEDTCRVAPSVTDAYQNQGVGSPLMQHIAWIARQLGRKNMVLMEGVYGHNARARHYYQKTGFREVGTFTPTWSAGRPCFDMIMMLD